MMIEMAHTFEMRQFQHATKPIIHLQGAFKPILIQLLLEVDHVSLLEAELAGVLGLEVVECLKDHLVKLVPIQPRTLHHFNIKTICWDHIRT